MSARIACASFFPLAAVGVFILASLVDGVCPQSYLLQIFEMLASAYALRSRYVYMQRVVHPRRN